MGAATKGRHKRDIKVDKSSRVFLPSTVTCVLSMYVASGSGYPASIDDLVGRWHIKSADLWVQKLTNI